MLIWVDAPEEQRYRRAMARDGDAYAPHWARWAAQERAHFAADRTRERADVRLRTG
jgi:dephospho-CoA kinase